MIARCRAAHHQLCSRPLLIADGVGALADGLAQVEIRLLTADLGARKMHRLMRYTLVVWQRVGLSDLGDQLAVDGVMVLPQKQPDGNERIVIAQRGKHSVEGVEDPDNGDGCLENWALRCALCRYCLK